MKLPPLIEGRLIRRYQRFLADVELADGRRVTAHTPNTGRMRGLTDPGNRVWLRDSNNPKRKYRYSWVLVETPQGVLVGIDTGLANALAREGIEKDWIPELQGYRDIHQEVRYGKERSRIDLLLQDDERPPCYVEVKNVTLVEQGTALFPDAVTLRGQKHMRELAAMVREGARAVVLYCIQRGDARTFRPADHIDREYVRAVEVAAREGVELLAYRARVGLEEIRLEQKIPVQLDP